MGTLNSSLSRRLETSNLLALGESYKMLNTYYSILFTLVIKFPIDATFTTHTFCIYCIIFQKLSRRLVKYRSWRIIYTPKFKFLSCEASTKQLSQQDMKRGWCKEQCLAPLKVCYNKSYLFVWIQFSVAHKVPDE